MGSGRRERSAEFDRWFDLIDGPKQRKRCIH